MNSISYADWVDGITVNLSTALAGNATAIGGILSNFSIVIGGGGDDVLTGNASQPTVLVGNGGNDSIAGGSGRDLLFGGWGADVLLGGSGEDLLIAGSTAHDSSATALSSLLAEWKITSRSFATRVNNIRGIGSGVRLNDEVFLNLDTIFGDLDLDLLTGNANADWFWGDASEVTDFVPTGSSADRRDDLFMPPS